MNKISLGKIHSVAYVLDVQSLRGFFNLLQKAGSTVEVKIETKNDITPSYRTLNR